MPLAAPVIAAPLEWQTVAPEDDTVTASWNYVSGGASSRLQVFSDPELTDLLLDQTTPMSLSRQIPVDPPPNPYYIRVAWLDGDDVQGDWSEVRAFDTEDPVVESLACESGLTWVKSLFDFAPGWLNLTASPGSESQVLDGFLKPLNVDIFGEGNGSARIEVGSEAFPDAPTSDSPVIIEGIFDVAGVHPQIGCGIYVVPDPFTPFIFSGIGKLPDDDFESFHVDGNDGVLFSEAVGEGTFTIKMKLFPTYTEFYLNDTLKYTSAFGTPWDGTQYVDILTGTKVSVGGAWCSYFSMVGEGLPNNCSGSDLQPPTLLTPENESEVEPSQFSTVVLDWTDVETAVAYHLQMATDAEFTNIVRNEMVATSRREIEVGSPSETLYWRVASVNDADEESDWSDIFVFTTFAFSPTPEPPLLSAIPQVLADSGNRVCMRYSFDRGKTWSNENWKQNGGGASYVSRLRWVGIGSGFGVSFWFRCVSDKYISLRSIRIRAQ